METLIELLDRRPLENILGAEVFRPKRVVYICPEFAARSAALHKKMRAYFERRGCGLTAGTADEAADAIRRLASDPELARRLADAAWKTGRAFHDTSAVHDLLVRQLAELTENGLRTDSAKSNKD